MSSPSRGSEAEAAREAGVVQAGEADLEEEVERQQLHQVVAAAAVAGFRLARQLEEAEEVVAAQPRMAVAEEEQPGRWLEVMEVAQGHLLLGRAVEVAPRQLAAAVPEERWRLVAEEALPGFSQVGLGPAGKLEEEEAARLIQGPSEAVVAADLAGQRSSLVTEVEEARGHDFVVEEEHSFVPGMPGARRTCGLLLWCPR